MVPATLATFNINTFSPVGNDDELGTATTQARRKTHQLPNLLDQQIVVLVGLDINPSWVRERSITDSLIYGTMKPDGTAPAGINEDYSHLVTSNRDKEISLLFKVDRKKVAIKCISHGGKLHTKIVPLSRLVGQSYRTKKQRQQANKYASALWTEQLIGHRKLGL